MSKAGAPKENKNAEKWTIEEANDFMDKAVELSANKKYDFVGEVAKELGQYHQLFTYLKDKFPDLDYQYKMIFSNCETNCFLNGKKGDIIPSLAIMNLKSNHKWTDRVDNTTKDKELTTTNIVNLGTGVKPNETTN